MGHIFIKTSILSFTGYAIYRVVENSAPTVEITRQVFAAPHPERGVTFDPLNPVMHQVQLWESIDGTSLDTLRCTIDVDASINNELQVTSFDIVVDRGNPGLVVGDTGDPVADTYDYLDARMKDQTYQVNQRGFGPLRPEDEITDLSNDVGTGSHGGFRLTGNPFQTEDTYFVTIWAATSVQTPASTDYPDVVLVGSDITIDATHYGKLIIANAGGNLQTLTIPAFSAIPDRTHISFSTQYGTYKYLKIQFNAGDSMNFNDTTKNVIYLSRDERIDLIFKFGTSCFIVNYDGRARERGKLYGDYLVRTGTVIADGTEYTKAQMEGFWDWLVNDCPSNVKCSYTDWAASTMIGTDTVYLRKGLFAVDLVGLTFKMPFVEAMFERYLLSGDSRRTPNFAGVYQHDDIRAHTHGVVPPNANSESGSGKTTTGGDLPEGTITEYPTLSYGGPETNSKNIGKIPLIVL